MFRRLGRHDLDPVGLEGSQRTRFIGRHEAAVADDISGQNCGQTAHHDGSPYPRQTNDEGEGNP